MNDHCPIRGAPFVTAKMINHANIVDANKILKRIITRVTFITLSSGALSSTALPPKLADFDDAATGGLKESAPVLSLLFFRQVAEAMVLRFRVEGRGRERGTPNRQVSLPYHSVLIMAVFVPPDATRSPASTRTGRSAPDAR